jgi:hypothetical protein
MHRALSDEAARYIAQAILAYSRKPGARDLSACLDARALLPADRRAVIAAVRRLIESGS